MFTAYLDESKNNDTFVIGGWVCSDDGWAPIEREWEERIEHEQRISEKHGFSAISRFHGADCSSLLNEFDRSKGWNNDRQLRLIKKLVQIMGKKRSNPMLGIVIGASLKGWEKAYRTRKQAEKNVYRLCMMNYASTIGDAIDLRWPGERFSIFYEDGPFNDAAQMAYKALKAPDCKHRHKIVTVAPLTWRDSIALQPADFLAYEGMKAINLGIKTGLGDIENRVRKSMQALLGTKVWLYLAYFRNDVFDATLNFRKTGKLESDIPVTEAQ